jgi:predicted house-cleaning noncanonical NTP pyrophosphatase (MazG superfamily)
MTQVQLAKTQSYLDREALRDKVIGEIEQSLQSKTLEELKVILNAQGQTCKKTFYDRTLVQT